MSQEFINLQNLIPGGRYSFTTTLFPGRVEGTFDRVTHRTGQDNQYIFSHIVTTHPHQVIPRVNFGMPQSYPRNITDLTPAGAPPLIHQQPPAGAPPDARGKSRKSKRTKRTRKSKRRHRKSKRTRK